MAAIRVMTFALLLVVLAAKPGAAALAYSYDVDSLAWIATDIVEGKVIQLNEDTYGISTVEVSAVHDGDFEIGDTIHIHFLDSYRKPGAKFHQTAPFESGDRLFLFLDPAPPSVGFTSGTPDPMTVVESGIRLIRDGKAVPFFQRSNPGYPVAVDPARAQELRLASVEEFRDRIAEGIDTAADLEERFAEPSSPDDVPALLDLLNKRIALADRRRRYVMSHVYTREKPAEEVCLRLANFHDIDALDTAAFLDLPSPQCRRAIENGFACPEGRDFLLARIGDEKQPMERRLRYARILRDAGREYHATHTDIEIGNATIIDRGRDDNAGYITRVARATADTMEKEELCLAMLDALERFAGALPGRPDDDPIREDLRGGVPALIEMHRETDSGRIRYHVENVIALVSRTKYKSLGSKSGPILSLIQPADPKHYGKPVAGQLAFTYEVTLLDKDSNVEAELMLIHEESGREYSVPSDLRLHGRSVGGFRRASLPENLPAGRYRVFLRFVRDGKVVSKGYGFETEL